MGLYDRDYVQQRPTYAGSASHTMVTQIIIVTGAVYLVDNFSSLFGAPPHWVNNLFQLRSDLWQHPWTIWELVTYGFAHAGMDSKRYIWHVAFNMYNLWLFGRAVEQKYGSREFLWLYLGLMVLSALVWITLQTFAGGPGSLIGASGAVAGILVLFVLNFPHEKFILFPVPIPVPAWVVGGLLVFFDLMGAMGYGDSRVAFSVHLGGAFFALLYYFSGIRLSRLWSPQWKWPRLGRSKPALRLHDPEKKYADLDRRADRILQKVHQHGANSITAEERKILDAYSRRMREKRR